jgi:group I intron endonuclease
MSDRYEKSIIYKICCKDVNVKEIYVGSTVKFPKRKIKHRYSCNTESNSTYNYPVYQYIRNNGNFDNFDFVIIEEYKAIDKKDLHKRERYWIEVLNPSLNRQVPTQTKKEYNQVNKQQIKEHKKKYNQENKEHIKERKKKKYQENKEKISEKIKEYRQKNKEKIKEYRKQKINCDCGSIVGINNISEHKKSKKHKNYLTTLIK